MKISLFWASFCFSTLLATNFISLISMADEVKQQDDTVSYLGLTPEPADSQRTEFDFGEGGDVILQIYLRDILLSDAIFAVMKKGNLMLPLGEMAYLLDFPIIVDSVSGTASGWYLNPGNTFSLDLRDGYIINTGVKYSLDKSRVFSDELDVYVDLSLFEAWFPLRFDLSLPRQRLIIRSSELLPKELARQRADNTAQQEVSFAATREFIVPGYRAVDWPELTVDLGGLHVPDSEITRYDYRVQATGDFAFMNGTASFSGNDEDTLASSFITLGRKNPKGMLGPLRIADYEVGDTSQFLPSLLGNSLFGRGFRFGNKLLADQRDIDTIDLQGVQQTDYEVELYVNSRLRGVDRDSSDSAYNFQDVRLQLGQNEIRLEFYGPQGQRYTESRRSFVSGSQGRKGDFTYEFSLLQPDRQVFDDFIDSLNTAIDSELPSLEISSALTLTYGISKRTGVALTIANLASNNRSSIAELDAQDNTGTTSERTNHTYSNTNITTDIAGTLVSTNLSTDPEGNIAASVAARSALGGYDIGASQQFFERDYRSIDNINGEREAADSTSRATTLNLTREFFTIPTGRLSYGTNARYRVSQSNVEEASIGTQVDYQSRFVGASWRHNYRRDITSGRGSSGGQIGTSIRPYQQTPWTLSSTLEYNDTARRLIDTGSIRLARSLSGNGQLSLAATRSLDNPSTGYSASLSRQFENFRFDSTIGGSSSGNVTVRLGVEFSAKRYPGRWLPTIASNGGSAAVAVIVFADDNGNGKHDNNEQVVEGIRITTNGLYSGAVTNSDGVAIVTGLSSNASVDLGIIEADLQEPDLKPQEITHGVLPRPGRVPVFAIPLLRATDLEGTVHISGTNPAPNVRMLLTPVENSDVSANSMEIYTEFDGYYYLSGVPLGEYQFGPDPEQLQAAGLVSEPRSRRLVLKNLTEFPKPQNFNLARVGQSGLVHENVQEAAPNIDREIDATDESEPLLEAALPQKETDSTQYTVSWEETNEFEQTSGANENIVAEFPTNDADKDGVLNKNDICQHTGRGSTVNQYGCVYIGERLSSISFRSGSATVTTAIAFQLNGVARELIANPSLKVTIETHTDNRGNAYYNMDLAKRRARSIIRYLQEAQHVPSVQLAGIAMGEAKPVASNRTRAGRKQNRGVLIRLAQ